MTECNLGFSDNCSKECIKEDIYQEIKVLLLNSSDPELEFLKDKIEKDGNIKAIAMAKNSHEAMNMTRLYDPELS